MLGNLLSYCIKGLKGNSKECPIARLITQALESMFQHSDYEVRVDNKIQVLDPRSNLVLFSVDTPKHAGEFISKFDNGEEAEFIKMGVPESTPDQPVISMEITPPTPSP